MKNTIKQLAFYFFLFLFNLSANSQTSISGIKNDYTKVISIISSDKISVESTAAFKANDTVLIIQMKGADIDVNNNLVTLMYNTGRYEFQAIQSVDVGLQQIKFQHFFINKYDPTQCVQLVRVPSYQSAVVSATLIGSPWNGKYGGIVALFVNDTLELKADINSDAIGFRGADTTLYNIPCSLLPENRNYLPDARNRAGLKGEGIIWSSFTTTRGNGAIANAGGGGNNKHSGGGGGAGYGDGGLGGTVSLTCSFGSSPMTEGEGGSMPTNYFGNKNVNSLADSAYRDRLFVGGGGGASNGLQALSTVKGGNGGGLVFVITRFLKTNNHNITANGESVAAVASLDAGTGGGGGGGSVVMAYDSLNGNLNINVSGGIGGNTSNYNSGQGGGGGGGFVWLSPNTFSINHMDLSGGDPGINNSDNRSTAYAGSKGDTATRLNPVLNGFLFNIVGSPQTICFHDIPQKIIGSSPRGGDGNYIYSWQQKNRKTAWITLTGANEKNLQPANLDDTTLIRRIVTVKRYIGAPAADIVSDTGKYIQINVIPEIKFNTIQPDTAICSGLKQVLLKGNQPTGGDGGAISFQWTYSTDGNNWTIPTSGQTGINYSNTSNTQSMYYRRKAFNNICSPSSNTVLITVYPVISHASVQIDISQTICINSTPKSFAGKGGITPAGGSGTYLYKWEKSTPDSLTWSSSGIATQTMSAPALSQQTFYRRIVYSGLNNTCKDTSNIIKISVVPKISNNTITSGNQTICQFTNPETFIGSQPAGGNGSYRYQWDFLDNGFALWDSVTTNTTLKDYTHTPLTLAGIARFKRIIRSGLNDCCRDTSPLVTVTVQPNIKNNSVGNDTTICQGQQPVIFLPLKAPISGGDNVSYTFNWQKHVSDSLWKNPSEIHNDQTFTSGSLQKTTYFARIIKSGTCIDTSNIILIKVLPSLSGNIIQSSFNKVCKDSIPQFLYSENLTGGDSHYSFKWTSATRSIPEGIIAGATDANYVFKTSLSDTTIYRRIVMSGLHNCCIDSSTAYEVKLIYKPLEAGTTQFIDTTFTFALDLHGLPITAVDSGGIWNAFNDKTVLFTPDNNPSTRVDNLKFGKNTLTWTIYTSKACPPSVSTILINVTDIVRYTGFSPNGDNLNEYFVIDGLDTNDAIESKELTVLNRWGNIVYQNAQYDNSWNGTNKNGEPVPDDTYYYVLKVRLKNNDLHLYKGFVVIKR